MDWIGERDRAGRTEDGGFEHMKYEMLGTFVKPVSVIGEFDGLVKSRSV